jgi:hypothetical protein
LGVAVHAFQVTSLQPAAAASLILLALLPVSQLQSGRAHAAAVTLAGYLSVWGSVRVTSGRSARMGSGTRFSGHQPMTTPLLLLLLRCLQVKSTDVEVRACAALYLMLPGCSRVGAPEALGSGQL